MGFAFLDDAEGVVAGEIDEPFAWDEFGVMGFGDMEPAAVDPSAESFSPFLVLFVMAHPPPLPPLPCGFVVGGGGEVIDKVGFADQPLAAVSICDELALVDRRVDGVLAHVDQP